MKLSFKLQEDKNPVLKARIPISIFSQPFVSSLTTTPPTTTDSSGGGSGSGGNKSSQNTSFSLSTNFPSGPCFKLSYAPSASSAITIPFSLSLKSGLGLFGSPKDSPLIFSAHFSLSSVNPGTIIPTFALHFKPQFGNFSLYKATSSKPSLEPDSRPHHVSGQSASPSNSEFGTPDSASVWQDVKLEPRNASDDGLDTLKFGYGNGLYSTDGFGMERSLVRKDDNKAGIFGGIAVRARTMFPVTKRAVVKLRWIVNLPSDLGSKMPYLTINKIGVEKIEEAKEANPTPREEPKPTNTNPIKRLSLRLILPPISFSTPCFQSLYQYKHDLLFYYFTPHFSLLIQLFLHPPCIPFSYYCFPMAVQAQYPSNVLFLNRGGQEEHEFSLQQQAGGVFLNQPHMLFNNGTNNNINPRKRAREVTEGAAITTPMNSYSLQMQPPQLIELSQLHQPNVVFTGLQLSFGGDQQQYQNPNLQKQQHQHQQRQQNLVPSSTLFLSVVSDELATQIKRQREELDQFLQAQGKELRRTLAEKRNRHYHALLAAAEESVARRLREKEAEVEKATRRNAELEACSAQLSVEVQVWQAKARAQEATATSLQAQLQQAMIGCGAAAVTQDSRRGEEGIEGQAEDAESAYVDPERMVSSGPSCKACRTRVASVVLLPCRHLCLCTECDRVAQACPLCLAVRNSSVEVFLS